MLAVQNIGPIVLSKLQRARLRRTTWKKIRIDVLNRKSAGEEPRIFHPGICDFHPGKSDAFSTLGQCNFYLGMWNFHPEFSPWNILTKECLSVTVRNFHPGICDFHSGNSCPGMCMFHPGSFILGEFSPWNVEFSPWNLWFSLGLMWEIRLGGFGFSWFATIHSGKTKVTREYGPFQTCISC